MSRFASRAGQSTIEYLVVSLALIATVLLLRNAINWSAVGLMARTRDHMALAVTDDNATADNLFHSLDSFR